MGGLQFHHKRPSKKRLLHISISSYISKIEEKNGRIISQN